MAIVTKDNDEKKPMDDEGEQDRPEPVEYARPTTTTASRGFLSIYKPGQGYWTRVGTAGGAAVVLAFIARFIYVNVINRTNLSTGAVAGIVGGFAVAVAIVLWHYLNKPSVVDFFIATESEMKKVNWTSRKDLIGSTKVVIGFMIFVSLILFLIDLFFGYFFWLIHVLKQKPF